MASLVEAEEPKGGGVDGPPDGQEAVVLQDDGLAVAQGGGDALAFLAVEHHAAKVAVDGVRLVEAQRVLRHHVQLAAEDGEGLAVDAVRVARRVDVRPRLVDLRVDGERGRVDGFVADHDVAVLVDQDQVRHADLREVLRERVEPCSDTRAS